ncbi:GNAT family N-acetyltransferase [Nocardia sp. NPDC101769]|uniref:GNAT family N-acetyltransferase n=1 Tax=Nocardia sp. NPDC101769 TaxID=3364333 RepID=UPI00380409C6
MLLRRAEGTDAADIAELWLRSFAAALPGVQRGHSDEAVRRWFADVVVPQQETWVAVVDEDIRGFLVLEADEVEQLYLEPTWRGSGLGDQLIGLAKELRPNGLGLWTFQVNGSARRFYQRHGFVEIDRTDGRRNEEGEPDVRYAWRP